MTLTEDFLLRLKARLPPESLVHVDGESNAPVTVATTGTQLLGPNPNRVSVYFENQDTVDFAKVRRGIRLAASTDAGARIDAGGGFYSAHRDEIGDAICEAWFAVADTASADILVDSTEAKVQRPKGSTRGA